MKILTSCIFLLLMQCCIPMVHAETEVHSMMHQNFSKIETKAHVKPKFWSKITELPHISRTKHLSDRLHKLQIKEDKDKQDPGSSITDNLLLKFFRIALTGVVVLFGSSLVGSVIGYILFYFLIFDMLYLWPFVLAGYLLLVAILIRKQLKRINQRWNRNT